MSEAINQLEYLAGTVEVLAKENQALRDENARLKAGIVRLIHAGTISVGQAVAMGVTMEQLYEANKQLLQPPQTGGAHE